jgi:uncharacterized small protein (DUF1192 family)
MDWDEPEAKSAKNFTVGEDLAKLSVVELEERIVTLKAEILRIEQTIAAKKRTTAAAAALFGGE